MALPGRDEVDDPGIGEPLQPVMAGRLPGGDVVLHLLIDRAGHHIIPGKRSLCKVIEEGTLTGRESGGAGGKHRRIHPRGHAHDILAGDTAAAVRLRLRNRCTDQIDPHPYIPGIGGQPRYEVKDPCRHHPRVEALLHPVAEDRMDLSPGIRPEVDLVRVEDRPHRPVGLGAEVLAEIVCDRKDPGIPDAVPSLMETEELVEEDVVGVGRDQVVCIIKADQEAGIRIAEPGGYPIPDLVEVPADRGSIPTDLLEYGPVDCGLCCILPAVDVGRDNLPGGLFEFGKDPEDRCCLSGPGGASEDGVYRPPTLEGGVDEEGKFLDLGIAVMKVFRDERGIEDLRISKEGLVIV